MPDPDAAERVLHGEDADAEEEADGGSCDDVQTPVIEKKRSYDALGDVVGHTHAAVGDKERQPAAEACGAVISEDDSGHEHDHESELVERRQDDFERRQNRGIADP